MINKKEKIIVFRVGSIGDTVVALPALRLIRHQYQNANIIFLTNVPISKSGKEMSAISIVNNTGLIDDFLNYSATGFNGLMTKFNLLIKLIKIRPDRLFYLMPPRTYFQLSRDAIFFKICGIRKLIGLNFSREHQIRQYDKSKNLWEHESSRLMRLIESIGSIDLLRPSFWSLSLSLSELKIAKELLVSFRSTSFFVMSIGTKVQTKDWGEDRWIEFTRLLRSRYPNYALVLIGSADEYARSNSISEIWGEDSLNLCGNLSPRLSAAIMQYGSLFIGHDSGPMHLASTVGIPIVAVFSAQNKPGEWFPFGINNSILYHRTNCFGCGLSRCIKERKRCIRSITANDAIEAVENVLNK
jgi:ADP-heptose:LPS heptosyltransferase